MEFGSKEKINGHRDIHVGLAAKYTHTHIHTHTHTHTHTQLVKSNKQKRTGHTIRNNTYLRYKGKKRT